ncbi:MAG: TIM barrel protein, partial [Oscillospiraceae bacterium]
MKYKLTGFADEIAPELDVQLAALNHLGIKNVELRGIDGKSVAEITLEEAKVVHEKLHAAGVAVSAIGSPIGKISINEDFSAHFALFQHVVALCEILGTNYIRMFSFFIPTGENPEKYKGEVMNRLRQMRDYAAEKGIVLLHENEKEIYGDTAPRCLQIMQELYGPHFKAIFDFANFVQCGQNTLSAYEELKPYIAYIHIKDAKGAQVMPAGMGDGNVKEILQQL